VTKSTAEMMVQIDAALQRLADGTRELVWDWDRRFGTAVGRVSDPDHLAVLTLADDCVAHRWDHETIDDAPNLVREICNGWGGLRPGQLLWASDPTETPLLFAAWWPWGSGTTFSLRIGCQMGDDAPAQTEMVKRLRSLFSA
jgi:hypothetical protein